MLRSPASPEHDPLLKEMYEDLPTMSNAKAAELMLAVQRVIRGENLDDTDPEAAQLYRAWMAAADKASESWTHNREKFITDSYDEANMPTEKEAVRLRAELKQRYAMIKQNEKMSYGQKRKWMENHVKNGPFEEVYVEPIMVIGRAGQQNVTNVEGQVVGLCGVQLYLQPGKNERVPQRFAERYRQILRSRKETEARKSLLQGRGIDPTGGLEAKDGWEQVSDGMDEINREFGSTSGGGEAGDNWLTPDLHQRF